jgi:nucleotide-binding universal stress UspA family protein
MGDRFTRILSPVDIDELSSRAVERARAIARSQGATLVLLHAVPTREAQLLRPEYRPDESGGADLQAAERIAAARLQEAAAAWRAEGLSCEVRIVTGPPARAILEAAERERVDLIVLSDRRDRSRIREWLLGSTTYEVVRRASTHVLIIH